MLFFRTDSITLRISVKKLLILRSYVDLLIWADSVIKSLCLPVCLSVSVVSVTIQNTCYPMSWRLLV